MNAPNSNETAIEIVNCMPENILLAYPFIETWAASHDDYLTDETNSDALAYLHDAQSGIGEDFMQAEIDRLYVVVKAMRKSDTKEQLLTIIEELEHLQQTTANAAEYEREQLGKARAVLGG